MLGVLAIYHAVDFRLPAEDREFLETMAAHAALALENARLFGEIRRRQETAEALADITQTLTASLDLRTVLAGVAEGVRELFGADGGAIGLITRRGAMRIAARVGLGADALRHLVVGPGQGGTGWVLQARPDLPHERLRTRPPDRQDPHSRRSSRWGSAGCSRSRSGCRRRSSASSTGSGAGPSSSRTSR